jgi:hypothetical protein
MPLARPSTSTCTNDLVGYHCGIGCLHYGCDPQIPGYYVGCELGVHFGPGDGTEWVSNKQE